MMKIECLKCKILLPLLQKINSINFILENPLEYGYHLYSISDLGMLVTWFSYVTACDCPSLIQIIHLHSSKIPIKSRVMLFTLLHQKVLYLILPTLH